MNKLETVTYADGETTLTGLYAAPDGTARGAVTVYPTFINSTPSVEAKAVQLVDEGYASSLPTFTARKRLRHLKKRSPP